MKRQIIISVVLVLINCLLNGQSYKIQGKIKNGENKVIQLIETYGGQIVIENGQADKIIASCVVKNGQFSFAGNLNEIMNVAIKIKNGRQKNFILEPGTTIIEADANKLWETKFINSKETEMEYELYRFSRPPEVDSQNVCVDRYELNIKNKNYAAAKADSLKYIYFERIIDSIRSVRTAEFIESHPRNFVSLSALNLNAGKFELNKTKKLLNDLEPYFKRHSLFKIIQNKINQLENKVEVGTSFPKFVIINNENKQVNLNDIVADFLIVDFWASWCAPCRIENKTYQKIFKEFDNKKIKIVSISLDDSKANWLNAIAKDKMSWINLADLKGWNSEIVLRLGINSIPASYVLNKERTVIAINLRGEDLFNKIKLLTAN